MNTLLELDAHLESEYQSGRICKRCKSCHGLIYASWKYCINCGEKLLTTI